MLNFFISISLCSVDYTCFASRHIFYIEMACNGCFGAGAGMQIAPPDPNATFTVSQAEIAVIDKNVYNLLFDLEILIGLVEVSKGYSL